MKQAKVRGLVHPNNEVENPEGWYSSVGGGDVHVVKFHEEIIVKEQKEREQEKEQYGINSN